jgi:hypothetical protein
MNKIDKLVSLVLSELEGGYIRTKEEGSDLYVYYYLNNKIMFYFEKNIYHTYRRQIIIYKKNLPLGSIISSSLSPEDYTTFLEQFTISILPMFSDYIDINNINNIETLSLDVWSPDFVTIEIYMK